MPPAVIRKLVPSDIETCRDLYLRNEPEHFPDGHFEDFKKNLTLDTFLWLVIEIENQVIGVGGICLESDDNSCCHLSFGMIHPEQQRQGFGSALLLARLAALPKPEDVIFVFMAPVRNSVKYYERFGFEFAGRARLGKSREKTEIYCSVLGAAAWEACASLLSASKIDAHFDQYPVPVRASGK